MAQFFKLNFVPESSRGIPVFLEGTATEILDQWNALPEWIIYDGANFRQRLVENTGADAQLDMPAEDEEILRAVAWESGPDSVTLEELNAPESVRGAISARLAA